MNHQPKLQKVLYFFLAGCFPFFMHAQVNAGAYFSTFHLPAAEFRTNGLGVSFQYEADKKTVYELSVAYFSKKGGVDSFSYLQPDASTAYIKYNDNQSFYHFSADFLRYLAGSTYYKDKFAFYLGAGLSLLQRQTSTKFQTSMGESQKESFTTFGFEYIMGLEAKLGIVRVFLRGKANLFLKYPVPIDDTVIPLLTNTQGGILVPLIKHKRPHGRVVM